MEFNKINLICLYFSVLEFQINYACSYFLPNEIFIVIFRVPIYVFIFFFYLHKVRNKIKYNLSLSYRIVKFLSNLVYMVAAE